MSVAVNALLKIHVLTSFRGEVTDLTTITFASHGQVPGACLASLLVLRIKYNYVNTMLAYKILVVEHIVLNLNIRKPTFSLKYIL